MKKLALLLTLALPMVFASCGNDEPEDLLLNKTSLTLNYYSSETLTSSVKNTTWVSSDPFVASVEADGKVTGNHVGTAVITATANGVSVNCNVTVNPIYVNYVMPCLQWGANQATVKNAVSGFELDNANSNSTRLFYWKDLATHSYPAYLYMFGNTGGLTSSSLIVDKDELTPLHNWMLQYYEVVEEDSDDAIYVYGHGNQYVVCDYNFSDTDYSILNLQAIWVAPGTYNAPAVRSSSAVKEARSNAVEITSTK